MKNVLLCMILSISLFACKKKEVEEDVICMRNFRVNDKWITKEITHPNTDATARYSKNIGIKSVAGDQDLSTYALVVFGLNTYNLSESEEEQQVQKFEEVFVPNFLQKTNSFLATKSKNFIGNRTYLFYGQSDEKRLIENIKGYFEANPDLVPHFESGPDPQWKRYHGFPKTYPDLFKNKE